MKGDLIIGTDEASSHAIDLGYGILVPLALCGGAFWFAPSVAEQYLPHFFLAYSGMLLLLHHGVLQGMLLAKEGAPSQAERKQLYRLPLIFIVLCGIAQWLPFFWGASFMLLGWLYSARWERKKSPVWMPDWQAKLRQKTAFIAFVCHLSAIAWSVSQETLNASVGG